MFEQILPNYPIFDVTFFGNTVAEWIQAVVVFCIALLVLKLFQTIIIKRLQKLSEKTKTELDDVLIDSIDAIYWPFYVFAAVYIAIHFINVSEIIARWSYNVFLIVVIYYVIKFFTKLVDFGAKTVIDKKREEENTGIIRLISTVLKIVLWSGAVVLILANMGYNVTSLIAGLGVGGIAVALALQNILGDLFGSLVIYFDKPFKIGDFIVIGDQMGTVNKIGVKTTRIQTPQGEELVVSNSELTKTWIRNFGVMQKRRNVQNIGVTYDTPAEKLKRIPEMLIEAVKQEAGVECDRVHFKNFGDSSLVFEVVYYILSGDYVEYMDKQQSINLRIVERFNKENIEMAFPTQTVYIKKD